MPEKCSRLPRISRKITGNTNISSAAALLSLSVALS
jgi:hypothetical protein